MGTKVDACGLVCPAPILLVKDVLEKGKPQQLTVLVDNPASFENVNRFLNAKGYVVATSQDGEVYSLSAQHRQQEDKADIPQETDGEQPRQKMLVLVTTDCLGSGDDLLGRKLMAAYLKTLKELGPDLWQIIFVNGGVKLTTAASPALEDLLEYEKAGVIILACGTCLEHFGLTREKKVGSTTNMLDIVTATQLADKTITIS